MEIRKNNKRKSLIMHIMSIVLCLAMLAGATFAWFSDHAEGSNTINTGNLDVKLKHLAKNADGSYTEEEVLEGTELFLNTEGEPIQWEPGAMATETFVVENAGDLAIVYELALSFAEEGRPIDDYGTIAYLREHMKVAMKKCTDPAVPEEVTEATLTENFTFVGFGEEGFGKEIGEIVAAKQVPGAEQSSTKEAWTVVVYWEAVDSFDGDNWDNNFKDYEMTLNIDLNATQLSHEKDSLGTGYDSSVKDKFIDRDNVGGTDEGNTGTPDEGNGDGGNDGLD